MGLRSYVMVASRDSYLNRVLSSAWVPRRLRSIALTRVGHSVANSAVMNPGCFLGARTGLTLGEGSFINYGCFFDLGAKTVIGSRVNVGYESMFLTCTHEVGPAERRAGTYVAAPIVIGSGAWIGARVVIMPGVTVGAGCVIASGSVVVSDCAPNTVYAGIPAVSRRTLET